MQDEHDQREPTRYVNASYGGRAAGGNYIENRVHHADPCPRCETRWLTQGRRICRHCRDELANDIGKLMIGAGFIGCLFGYAGLNSFFEWLGWGGSAAFPLSIVVGVLCGLLAGLVDGRAADLSD